MKNFFKINFWRDGELFNTPKQLKNKHKKLPLVFNRRGLFALLSLKIVNNKSGCAAFLFKLNGKLAACWAMGVRRNKQQTKETKNQHWALSSNGAPAKAIREQQCQIFEHFFKMEKNGNKTSLFYWTTQNRVKDNCLTGFLFFAIHSSLIWTVVMSYGISGRFLDVNVVVLCEQKPLLVEIWDNFLDSWTNPFWLENDWIGKGMTIFPRAHLSKALEGWWQVVIISLFSFFIYSIIKMSNDLW